MPVYNSEVAETLQHVADLLDIEGANEFRVRAYRNAARTITTLSRDVAEMVEQGEDLTELEGIGEDLAAKIAEIVKTGGLQQLQELEQRTPPALVKMLNIAGLGPKRVQALYEGLGVTTLDELHQAAEEGKIRKLEGFGEKTEQNILDELDREPEEQRTLLSVAEEYAGPL
ncbi:MAG: helix-hairpin-helix domain-containing protein, partial [Anaerolineae bacterium]